MDGRIADVCSAIRKLRTLARELLVGTVRKVISNYYTKTMNFAVIYEKTSTGYSAYIPDLPGCIAAGATFEDTAELIRGAIEIHLESMREDGDSIPERTTIAGCVAVPA